ncbi:mannitol dehydrogenase family protein [Amycolatopsis endophytica]|uniref:Fructuronate reductase n=1 Tax=Amycolatopsis endophytica TaxID=860233 RepID=A0A853B9D0_9PSEU|nr:mannitol dehydrogenase family protein [Amycolatopsis endophytica]NYI91610.1 fructuronate reductase [Amycolatopsis endophytica]
MTPRLTRASAPPPVRAVHLGLGAFHRAHQAWYTAADPAWGIAAYTFRNTELPRLLTRQDGLFSLLVRDETRDRVETVGSIVRAHPGADTRQWLADVASPEVALITITVTEAAYTVPEPGADSAVSRLAAGLRERFHAGAAPITLVPCDNVADNGEVLRSLLRKVCQEPAFAEWVEHDVAVAGTVVDRITPATTKRDVRMVRELTGRHDPAAVVTEPFAEWQIAGTFPRSRPAWERAGAQVVGDIGTYQRRKLWLLNAAHSLLAYTGLVRGHATVDQAAGDPVLGGLIESWWDTAAAYLPLPPGEITSYRRRLRDRFTAPGIRHLLSQIAADGSHKIPARILPVLHRERARGRLPHSAVAGLAAWLDYLRERDVRDARAAELVRLARTAKPAQRVLVAIDPGLGDDRELLAAIDAELREVRAF